MKSRYDLLRRSIEAGSFSGTDQPTVWAAFGLGPGENYDAPALTRVLRKIMRQLHPDKLQHAGNPLRARHLARLFAGLRYLREDLEYEQQGQHPQFEVDTSFSRPVWPQFCFYPLRGITQRTQSDGRWLRSGFVEVGNR